MVSAATKVGLGIGGIAVVAVPVVGPALFSDIEQGSVEVLGDCKPVAKVMVNVREDRGTGEPYIVVTNVEYPGLLEAVRITSRIIKGEPIYPNGICQVGAIDDNPDTAFFARQLPGFKENPLYGPQRSVQEYLRARSQGYDVRESKPIR